MGAGWAGKVALHPPGTREELTRENESDAWMTATCQFQSGQFPRLHRAVIIGSFALFYLRAHRLRLFREAPR
jgi:hypothetical protein